MNQTTFVLSAYAFSNNFRKQILKITGSEPKFVSVGELRAMGMRKMLAFLHSMKRDAVLYIPLEDPQSESLFPLLLGLVSLSSAKVKAIHADGTVRDVGRSETVSSIARVLFASLAGIVALMRCEWSSRSLLRRKHEVFPVRESSNKILYLNANYWFGLRIGGSVGHIAGVVNALADAGYHVELASANRQAMLRPQVCQFSLKVLQAHGYPQEINFLRFHHRVISFLRSRRYKDYRLLYQRMSLLNFSGVVLSRLWRIPLVLEYNGSEIWIGRNWGRSLRFSKLGLRIEGVNLRLAHRVVVVSKVLAQEVIARGVDPDRVVCYPNCVDPSHFNPEAVPANATKDLRERHGIAEDEVIVAFVGTFGTWHGAPVLAECIKELVDNRSDWLVRRKVRFAMIGDGAKMPEVKKFIGGERYSRWVLFTGLVPQQETVKYLAACDVLVSPHVANTDGSRFFGSPTKLFEYMAMGKGIIASDLDQIGEVLSAGMRIWEDGGSSIAKSNAVLVRPGNLDDLARGIQLLVENPDLRRAIGSNARKEVLSKYTWNHHVAHLLQSLGERTIPHGALTGWKAVERCSGEEQRSRENMAAIPQAEIMK
jgi:glycosyltransferase involved in cell wall biosynthesis